MGQINKTKGPVKTIDKILNVVMLIVLTLFVGSLFINGCG
jgi:hypothetical protein